MLKLILIPLLLAAPIQGLDPSGHPKQVSVDDAGSLITSTGGGSGGATPFTTVQTEYVCCFPDAGGTPFPAALSGRVEVLEQNLGPGNVWIGAPGVSQVNGIQVPGGSPAGSVVENPSATTLRSCISAPNTFQLDGGCLFIQETK